MKVVQVYNLHRFGGGLDVVAQNTTDLLKNNGVKVFTLMRDSRELGEGLLGKLQAFFGGFYSRSAYKEMVVLIKREHPDVVHVHNVYPLISPSVLIACRKLGVPVVMTCHDYSMVCPTYFHLCEKEICELCCGGREYWCILRNCRHNYFESVAYAFRNAVTRKLGIFQKTVTLFIALTVFSKDRLVDAGLPEKRIVIMPNMVSIPSLPADPSQGKIIAYVGRISPEKGVDILLDAASQTGLPLRLAGDHSAMPQVLKTPPKNVQFLGLQNRRQLTSLYQKARFVVFPSRGFECCPLVLLEAMSYGLPVLASRIGGIPEIVDDGVTGFLSEPGDTKGLVDKMRLLWESPNLCKDMGEAGRKKAIREFAEQVFYDRLINAYKKAAKLRGKINSEPSCETV